MRMNERNKQFHNLFLTLMLIVAMALTVTGCGNAKTDSTKEEPSLSAGASETGQQPSEEPQSQESQSADKTTVLGEGKTVFQFVVVDKDKNETRFEIHTDKTTVGDALLEHDLIAGDQGEYGLYVKQVNGIKADYDVDKTYWAFYINEEYASTGVDSTTIKEGETYTFKIEK